MAAAAGDGQRQSSSACREWLVRVPQSRRLIARYPAFLPASSLSHARVPAKTRFGPPFAIFAWARWRCQRLPSSPVPFFRSASPCRRSFSAAGDFGKLSLWTNTNWSPCYRPTITDICSISGTIWTLPSGGRWPNRFARLDFARLRRLYESRDEQSDLRAMLDRAASPPAFRLDARQNRFIAAAARQRGVEAAAGRPDRRDPGGRRPGHAAGVRSSQGHVPDRAGLRNARCFRSTSRRSWPRRGATACAFRCT